jgi:hypothetical protein
MTTSQRITGTILWGVFLWLIGYLAGVALFFVIPKALIGWVITPVATLLTIWVLFAKIKRPEMACYIGLGVVWTVLAVVLDYLFNVVAFKIGGAYYQPDIFLYYFLTFVLPIVIGYWKFAHKAKDAELF